MLIAAESRLTDEGQRVEVDLASTAFEYDFGLPLSSTAASEVSDAEARD